MKQCDLRLPKAAGSVATTGRSANILFINKSTTSTSLSHSEAKEAVSIRQFIQRQNRKVARLAKKHPSLENEPGGLIPTSCSSQACCFIGIGADDMRCSGTQYLESPNESRFLHHRPNQSSPISNPSSFSPPHCLTISVPSRVYWTSAELRGVSYFTNMVSSRFTTRESTVFWQGLLPQTIEAFSVLRMLVTAIALLHESFDVSDADDRSASSCRAQSQMLYHRALRGMTKSALSLPNQILDITCILVASYETLQGNYAGAETCITSGLAISGTSRIDLAKNRWENPVPTTGAVSDRHAIEATKAKMASQFHVFNVNTNDHFRLEDFVFAPSSREAPNISVSDINAWAETLYWTSLQSANIPQDQRMTKLSSQVIESVQQRFCDFEYRLHQFRSLASCPADIIQRFHRTSVQEMKVREAFIVFNCIVLYSNEESFDAYNADFATMLDIITTHLGESTFDAKRLLYHPFSAVFIPPLWLIASRCREPALRRRAIELLLTYRRRETSHDSVVAGRLAEHIARIEQRGLPETIKHCADIPLANRIRPKSAIYDVVCGRVELRYTKCLSRPNELRKEYKEWVDWHPWGRIPTSHEISMINGFLQISQKYM